MMKNFTIMNKTFRVSLTLMVLILSAGFTFSQPVPDSPQYENMKSQGLIQQPQHITPPAGQIPAMHPAAPAGNNGGQDSPSNGLLKVPLDGTFTLAMGPNDDLSSDQITLPFTFCFYGDNMTSFFINNNGNVSFGSSYSQFTATGFPVSGFPMLAPFWGDVDTRDPGTGPLGEVWYKMTATAVIVIWNNTGYFSEHGDLRNTFELIFTNGTDPLIGVGNNVAFSYSTMQWTTGDASSGSGGFGGTPATVGVNKGDGVKYALVGLFDHAGTDYDGPGGANDGVGYLTGQYYTFDACQGNVIIVPNEIPTLSQWGLIILGFSLLVLGTVYIMRRRGLTV
jgi:hypothetical protein